jgi:hypothetical protein
MKDNEIIELYWERNEAAITATAEKYGTAIPFPITFCIAMRMRKNASMIPG